MQLYRRIVIGNQLGCPSATQWKRNTYRCYCVLVDSDAYSLRNQNKGRNSIDSHSDSIACTGTQKRKEMSVPQSRCQSLLLQPVCYYFREPNTCLQVSLTFCSIARHTDKKEHNQKPRLKERQRAKSWTIRFFVPCSGLNSIPSLLTVSPCSFTVVLSLCGCLVSAFFFYSHGAVPKGSCHE